MDTSARSEIPGVKAVLNLVDDGGKTLRYQGDEVAAVAAITPEIAEDAIRAIKVKYQPLDFVVNVDKAREPEAPKVAQQPRERGAGGGRGRSATSRRGSRTRPPIIDGEYMAQTRLHCCLETHGHVCKWDGDKLTVWASTQGRHAAPEGSRGRWA